MAYETVGACLAENLRILKTGFAVPPENQAMWNLSNALLNLSASVEADLNEIQTQLRSARQEIDRLSRKL
jgi:hypothetical protein